MLNIFSKIKIAVLFSIIFISLANNVIPAESKSISEKPPKEYDFEWDLGRFCRVFETELKNMDKTDKIVYYSLKNSEVLLTVSESGIIVRRDYYRTYDGRGNFDRLLAGINVFPNLTGKYKLATFLVHFDAVSNHPLYDEKKSTGEYPSVAFIQGDPFLLASNPSIDLENAISKLRKGENLPLDFLLIDNTRDYSRKRIIVENIWRQISFAQDKTSLEKIRFFLKSVPPQWIKDQKKMNSITSNFLKRWELLGKTQKYSQIKDDTTIYKQLGEIYDCIK